MRSIAIITTIASCWAWTTVAFTNPIKVGSDPQVAYHNGTYYLTSTTWNDVQITSASTVEGLKTAEAKVIWSDKSDPNRACNFWAPEIHFHDGRWYVFFTASVCDSDWGVVLPTLRVYTLAGGVDDPLSSEYEMLGPITPPNFTDGMLDATIYDIAGKRYFIVSDVSSISSLERWTYLPRSIQVLVALKAPKAHPYGYRSSFLPPRPPMQVC
jgi:GH43 family beta-xylosidase